MECCSPNILSDIKCLCMHKTSLDGVILKFSNSKFFDFFDTRFSSYFYLTSLLYIYVKNFNSIKVVRT